MPRGVAEEWAYCDALPLRALRQVIIQDDYDTTLTVRPIASADDNLALVTLGAGKPLQV